MMRLYRALLCIYPASFRAEYGEEMRKVFEQRLRAATGLLIVALWIETLADVVLNAISVHFDILRQDLRYTARSLRQSPGFAITAATVAALGIGATTAAFTLVDHVIIRPLPFPDQDRLVKIYEDHSFAAGQMGRAWDVAPANYRDWQRMSTSFEAMAAHRGLSKNMIGQGDPQLIEGAAVTAWMFPMLGIKPAIGRIFTAEDDRETSPGTMILSYGLWQSQFGGDAGVLGRKIILDGAAYLVIGVMPKTFYFPQRNVQYWTAMRFEAPVFEDRTNTYIYPVAKLRRGVSLESAQTEMRTISGQLQRSYPKELAHVGATLIRLHDDISNQTRVALGMLLAAAACVLLVASMNLASLLLARAMMRKKELAVRAAMGAGRERLVRQMLTESLVLACAGGIGGIFLAVSAIPVLVRLVPQNLAIAEMPSIDWRVLLFALLLTMATGIAFGVFPALRVCRRQDTLALRETSRAGGGRRERLRSALVVAEVTGSLVLLVCCCLFIRALWRIQAVDPGFRPDNVLTLRTSLTMPKYERPVAQQQFYQRVLEQARQLPGVEGAAYTSFLPIIHGGGVWPVEVEGQPQDIASRQNASLRFVTPGYFSVMGIPLLHGRDVSESDTANGLFTAVVSESFVQHYWPGRDPIGRRFNFGNFDRVVVGVVSDVKVRGLERTSEPQVYLPYKQLSRVSSWYAPKDLAIRAAGNVAALAPALRRIVHEVDPTQPVSDVRLLSDGVEAQTGTRRVYAGVLGSFALIAFLLAAIGIHGLLAFAVSTRTQEIGVRMALGASPGSVLRMILQDGALLASAGVLLGTGLAYAAGLEFESLLAGVRPGDIASFATAIALCLIMSLAGSLIPALRAVRIDPTLAIRAE